MSQGHQDEHKIVLVEKKPDGMQEWLCLTCGWHIKLRMPPNYYREVLDEGDVTAYHSNVTGMEQTEAPKQLPEGELDFTGLQPYDVPGGTEDLDDPYLGPWADWLADQK